MKIISSFALGLIAIFSHAQTIESTVNISNGSVIENTAISSNNGVAIAGVVAVSPNEVTRVENVSVQMNSSRVRTHVESNRSGKTNCSGVVCITRK